MLSISVGWQELPGFSSFGIIMTNIHLLVFTHCVFKLPFWPFNESVMTSHVCYIFTQSANVRHTREVLHKTGSEARAFSKRGRRVKLLKHVFPGSADLVSSSV